MLERRRVDSITEAGKLLANLSAPGGDKRNGVAVRDCKVVRCDGAEGDVSYRVWKRVRGDGGDGGPVARLLG